MRELQGPSPVHGRVPVVSFRKPYGAERICEFYNEEALLEHMRLFVEYRVSLKDKTKPVREVRA